MPQLGKIDITTDGGSAAWMTFDTRAKSRRDRNKPALTRPGVLL
jgi:hypothetical protein